MMKNNFIGCLRYPGLLVVDIYGGASADLELELIQIQMAQKPMLRAKVCAPVPG
jgi:hypothetical protein